MISIATVAGLYCDKCNSRRWTYCGAGLSVCVDRALADGWQIVLTTTAETTGTRHICPSCARDGKAP